MKNLQKHLRTLVLAILAGGTIGIGGCAFLSIENKVVGALMFTVGLYTICTQELNLFTGKVGYLANQPASYCLDLLVIWIGNLVGTFLAALAFRFTRISSISGKAAQLCGTKLNDHLSSLFILAIFCGLLMFVAVDGFRATKNPLILFAGVAAFILCGFEHCIANMFYFSVARMWSGKAFLCIVIITLGNAIGGMLIPLGKKLPMGEDIQER